MVLDIVYAIACRVVCWRCPHCGRSFTKLPPICIPGKLYLRAEVEGRSEQYLENPAMSYREAVKENGNDIQHCTEAATAECSEVQKEEEVIPVMSHTTLYRWVNTLSDCRKSLQPVVEMALEMDVEGRLCSIVIAPIMYRSDERKRILLCACFLLRAKNIVFVSNPNRDATRGASP